MHPFGSPEGCGTAFPCSVAICSASRNVGQDLQYPFFVQRSSNYAGFMTAHPGSEPTWNIHVSNACPTSEVPKSLSGTECLGEMRE